MEGARGVAFAAKVHELISFLIDVRGVKAVDVELNARATYHDSCSGLRELGTREQPRRLLRRAGGAAGAGNKYQSPSQENPANAIAPPGFTAGANPGKLAGMSWHRTPTDDAWKQSHLAMVEGLGKLL